MSAIVWGHAPIVELLLQAGADPEEESKQHGTCLEIAASKGHKSIAENLLRFGANVNAEGVFYRDALHAASALGHTEIVECLLKHGALPSGKRRLKHDLIQEPSPPESVATDPNSIDAVTEGSSQEDQVQVSQKEEHLVAKVLENLKTASAHTGEPLAEDRMAKKIRVLESSSQDQSASSLLQPISKHEERSCLSTSTATAVGLDPRSPMEDSFFNQHAELEISPQEDHDSVIGEDGGSVDERQLNLRRVKDYLQRPGDLDGYLFVHHHSRTPSPDILEVGTTPAEVTNYSEDVVTVTRNATSMTSDKQVDSTRSMTLKDFMIDYSQS